MVFGVPKDRMGSPQGFRGVWDKISVRGGTKLYSSISLISLWLSPVNRPPVPNGKKRGGRERPPKKVGGM